MNTHKSLERAGDALAAVRTLLELGKTREALELIKSFGTGSLELSNAYGVALMRAGEASKAAELYRGLCQYPNSVCLKADIPIVFKTNYATALLLQKNVSGGIAILDEIGDESVPQVRKLREAIARWRHELGWKDRLAMVCFGTEPARPVSLDFEPGELVSKERQRPAA